MNNMDKLCLNWDGYDANIRKSFKKMREDKILFDVTLVTDDGKHIQAHKIILLTGSSFFSDIFTKCNLSNMVVFLKGISSEKLEPVIDFIYNGEAFISQEYLKVFIETGKELQIKGLEGEFTEEMEDVNKKSDHDYQESNEKCEDYAHEKVFTVSADDTIDTMDKIEHKQLVTHDEIDDQIDEMIMKNEVAWNCKICGKSANTKQHIKYHAEMHIEGMSYACNICNKTFSNRPSLRQHSDTHSELFSCDICGKTRMNKSAYRQHKRKYHN